jgi:surface antigen
VLEYAPDRRRVFWSNAENAHEYAVVPMRTYERADGVYCREYQTTATIAGRVQQVHGTACRQGDGAWKIVN